MSIVNIVDSMTPEMYERLKYAAETGKWPEGVKVDQAQRDSALQLSMAYQARRLTSDEMLTVGPNGEMVNKTKRELKAAFSENKLSENTVCETNSDEDTIARFKDL